MQPFFVFGTNDGNKEIFNVCNKRTVESFVVGCGILVVGFGMYGAFQVQDAEAHHDCPSARNACCYAIWVAQQVCAMFPYSGWCEFQYHEANRVCSRAAAECTTFSCSDWGG